MKFDDRPKAFFFINRNIFLFTVDLTLDMDGFNKIVEKLGTEYLVSPQGNIIREVTKTSNRLPSRGKGNKQEVCIHYCWPKWSVHIC